MPTLDVVPVSLLAVIAPMVAALSMDVPENPTSGGRVRITWSTRSGDPPVVGKFDIIPARQISTEMASSHAVHHRACE